MFHVKVIAGSLLLLAAEQAFAHAHLVQFPHHDAASSVLVPTSVVFLGLGMILLVWGLLTESRLTKTKLND
jgi:hypothetical protein